MTRNEALRDLLDLIDGHDDEYPAGAAAALREILRDATVSRSFLLTVETPSGIEIDSSRLGDAIAEHLDGAGDWNADSVVILAI